MAQLVPDSVLQQLKGEGWNLKQEAVQSLAEALLYDDDEDEGVGPAGVAAAGGVTLQSLRAALLDADLRKTGSGCLPDDVNRAHSSSIKGPMVLQVMSVTDVSKPSYAGSQSASRLLMLKLTDGRTSCKALEHKACSQLSDTIPPGSKAVLHSASVRLGVVLLEPRSLTLLGGRVDSLAEAWETQRKYGGARHRASMAAAAADAAAAAAPGEGAEKRLMSGATAASGFVDDGAAAPRFRQFVPGRDGRQQQQQQRAAAAPAKLPQQQQQQKQQQEHLQKAEAAAARAVDVAPVTLVDAATKQQQSAAQAKLLDKLERSQAAAADSRGGRGGRGRGRGRRRGRWGGGSDSDEEGGGGGTMTLEEYEARQKAAKAGGAAGAGGAVGRPAAAAANDDQMARDEELARQLQAQLDLEEAGYNRQQLQQHYGQRQQQPYDRQPPQTHARGYDGGSSSSRGRGRGRGGGGFGQQPYGHQQQQQQQHHQASGQDYTASVFGDMQPQHFRGRHRGPTGGSSSSRGRGRGGGEGGGNAGGKGRGSAGGRSSGCGSSSSRGGGRG